MAKTPKKPAPGGDESNLYVRRLKATTSASLSGCDASLLAKQRETENPNRGKAIAIQKKQTGFPGKVFKSKLRSPATTKSHRALKSPPRFQPTTSKEEKKLPGTSSTSSKDRETVEMPTTRAESEEAAAVQLKVSITKKDVKDRERIISAAEEVSGKPEMTANEDQANSNRKNAIDRTEAENATPRGGLVEKEGNGAADKNAAEKQLHSAERKMVAEPCDNGNESSETEVVKNNSSEEAAENRSSKENSLKLEDEGEPPKPSETSNGDSRQVNEGNDAKEIKDMTAEEAETKKMAENCSVDVVESTTTEPTDSGNATQSDKEAESNGGDEGKDNPEIDASFVSYDSSIMLKDVQIKLNDCLKENSKLFDVSNVAEENGAGNEADQPKRLDMSFGKTLRNISGRSTINRLKYVTVREHRFSPNSSLFVNTSSASLDPEDSTSCKLLRHTGDFSDSQLLNGSPADRKRKIVTESAASAKKLKTEEPERTSIFNTSLEILKSIRRPIQVSTPNAKGYQFPTDKYRAEGFGDDKLAVDAEIEPKKWCVVM